MAKEWACKNETDGFVNSYTLNTADLKILNLNDSSNSVLNWIAILLKNRIFDLDSDIAKSAREYMLEHFYIDISNYDVVTGYRADNSYFAFAESFVSNTLPLRSLNKALRLGKLGEQIALVSERAFNQITFHKAITAEKQIYYPKFNFGDTSARKSYRNELAHSPSFLDDIFVLDIIRQEMKNNDPRIQRIISE